MLPSHIVGLVQEAEDGILTDFSPLIDAFLELGMPECAAHLRPPQMELHGRGCLLYMCILGEKKPSDITSSSGVEYTSDYDKHWYRIYLELVAFFTKYGVPYE